MKIKKIFIVLTLMVMSSCVVHKPKEVQVKARITQYGIYETLGRTYYEKLKDSPSGRNLKSTGGVRLVKQTDKIPLIFNIRFGYDFEITGLPGDEVELIMVVKHPEIKRSDGRISTEFTNKWKLKVDNGVVRNGASYILNHDYELVEGEWTRSYYYKGKKILEKTFHVSSKYNYKI